MNISITIDDNNPITPDNWSWNKYDGKKFHGKGYPYSGETLEQLLKIANDEYSTR